MKGKQMLALTLLCLQIPLLYAYEVVFTFDSLGVNERLAYRFRSRELILYAQDKQSLYVTRLIGSWRNIPIFENFGFTDTRRDSFFTTNNPLTTTVEGWTSITANLYHLRGNEGTVARIFDEMRLPRFALSHDGRQMLVMDLLAGTVPPHGSQKEAAILLFDTETWELLHEFHWTVEEAVGIFSFGRRADGMFIVIHSGGTMEMGAGVYAVAKIDPSIGEMEILWDRTGWSQDDWTNAEDFQRPKNHRDFPDDRGDHRFDRTLHLERIIFAPQATSNTDPAVTEQAFVSELSPTQVGQNVGFPLLPAVGILGVLLAVSATTTVLIARRKKR